MKRLIPVAMILAGAVVALDAYVLLGQSWPDGSVVMHLQLGPSGGTLIDGTDSWGRSAEGALAEWNTYLRRVEFRVVRDSTAAKGDDNGINNVFWSSSIYGRPFGSTTLAVTTNWSRGATREEADVLFNVDDKWAWNSYFGTPRPGLIDFRRVALHEFGHVLGLGHPDQAGQSVRSIMHSSDDSIDHVQSDDITGISVLYGGSTTTLAVPGAPSGFSVSSVGTSVTMRWSAPTTGGTPTAYYIESGSSSGLSNLANISTGSTATSYSADRVGVGTYYVRVRAANSAGVGPASNESVLVVGGSSAPNPPTSFAVSVIGFSVTMTWRAPVGGAAATGYTIESGTSPGLSNLAPIVTGSTSTSYSADRVGSGTYYVRVRATNAGGGSAPSNEAVMVVPGGVACSPPGAPTLSVSAAGSTVSLSWSVPSGSPTSYAVEAGSGVGLANLANLELGAVPAFVATNVGRGLYYVRVRGRNSCGLGPASNDVSVFIP